jgi:hypothetical protein
VSTGDAFADVVGQEAAVAFLNAALDAPVHAYLFLGRSGSGTRRAARAFAGELLGRRADDGSGAPLERSRRLAASEAHPSLFVYEREGPSISADQAREIVRRASLAPPEGDLQVFLLPDFHLVRDAGPMLLKAIEEPHAGTIFLILAVSLYDTGNFLIGAQARHAWEGPVCGIIGVLAVTFTMAAFQPEPFDGPATWAVGLVLALACPLGQAVMTAFLPLRSTEAIHARRLDTYLLAAPLFLIGVWIAA